jgi:hypothetical protein
MEAALQPAGTPKEEIMKRQAIRTMTQLGLFVILAATSAYAQAGGSQQANVPFDFNVGSQTLPAGRYLFERINRQTIQETILLRTAEGRAIMMVRMMPADARSKQEHARLIFHRYGERYFLSQLVTPGDDFGLELPKSRFERRLERELVGSNRTKVMASVTVALGQAGR